MDDSMSDSQRERKRPRDDSEPVDDDDSASEYAYDIFALTYTHNS